MDQRERGHWSQTVKVRFHSEADGQIARLTLAAPKANILDREMMEELEAALDRSGRDPLKAIVLSSDGPAFSYGASVQEHLPQQIEATLKSLHRLLRKMILAPAPLIAAVKGQCLGGGFELVLSCDLILAEETAAFSCPEIKLGVFAPAASTLLPAKLGSSRAALMLLTGAPLSAVEAFAAGLVARCAPTGGLEETLREWLEVEFLPRSAISLQSAALASRRASIRALQEDLPTLESLYLHQLMADPDAEESIRAFLEKRNPRWQSATLAGH
jgi:cyclohexa-1,5-dienecarbonyl-CoA hydratase